MKIGTLLRKLRDNLRISSRNLAEKMNISHSTYMDWENDKSSPSLNNYFKIAEAFEISPVKLMSYLVDDTSNILSGAETGMAELTEKIETVSQYVMLIGNENKLIRNELKNMWDLINKRQNFKIS